MTWYDLTIGQAQQVYNIIKDDNASDFDKEIKVICLLLGYSEDEVNALELSEYKNVVKEISFFYYPIPKQQPCRNFKANGKKYFVSYDIQQVSFGQYNEVMAFSKGADYIINNLHKLMATIAKPVKGFGFLKRATKAKSHEQVSEDMMDAPFVACYHAAVFFYQVYNRCLKDIQPYLVDDLMKKGMEIRQATEATADLLRIMAGFGMQKT